MSRFLVAIDGRARRLLRAAEGFPNMVAALKAGQAGTIDGAWGSSAALSAAALATEAAGPMLVVLAHPGGVVRQVSLSQDARPRRPTRQRLSRPNKCALGSGWKAFGDGTSPADLHAFLPWQMTPERREELARPAPVTLSPLTDQAQEGDEMEVVDTS